MNRLPLTAIVLLSLCGSAWAQTPERAAPPPAPASYPVVTFGVVSFLGYSAELHESDGYNAFDVTRGYFNIQARLSDRVRVRFTPDVRPTTDASLDRNLALRLEYASLDVQVTDNVWVMFGLHETPWLTFEESLNRYRVLGPMFSERLGLIPGATDLGASIRATRGRTDLHVGVYNGEGTGRAEVDKYKSIDGRATFRPFAEDGALRQREHLRVLPVRLVRKRSAAQRGHRDGQLRETSTWPPRRSICRPPTTRSSPWTSSAAACRSSAKAARVPPAGPEWAVWTSLSRTRPTTATRDAATSSAARTGVR